MPSVTHHSPSIAANNTAEQLTCVFIDHMLFCGMWRGVGLGGVDDACCSIGNGSTIGNYVHVQLDQISCQFGIVMKNYIITFYMRKLVMYTMSCRI